MRYQTIRIFHTYIRILEHVMTPEIDREVTAPTLFFFLSRSAIKFPPRDPFTHYHIINCPPPKHISVQKTTEL